MKLNVTERKRCFKGALFCIFLAHRAKQRHVSAEGMGPGAYAIRYRTVRSPVLYCTEHGRYRRSFGGKAVLWSS